MVSMRNKKKRCRSNRPLKSPPKSRFCVCLPRQVTRLQKLVAKRETEVAETLRPAKELFASLRAARGRLKATRAMLRSICEEA